MPLVECKKLSFSYDGERKVLDNVSFCIHKGELLTLLGPNGVGKSTLLNCIAALSVPQSGELLLGGKRLTELSRKAIAQLLAYVPQKNNVPFDFRLREFVVMGRTARLGVFETPSVGDYRLADEALEKLGLSPLAERPVTELSGGEQQKACIARALVQEPQLIILDEPTAALDFKNQITVLNLIRELLNAGYAVLQTTHNPDHCLMLGGTVGILDQSGRLRVDRAERIVTEETLQEVYQTELRIAYVEAVGRECCLPRGL